MLLFCILFLSYGPAYAQTGTTSKYFVETGHNVSGEFWQFYNSQSNNYQIFGYPITEQFRDDKTGRVIQYFARARFELYPEKPAGQRVQLTNIGEALYKQGTVLNITPPIGCQTFSNGFAVCYDFLKFFNNNGGEAIFGMPISGFEIYNNRIVQYFQRARFEWYPEYPEGQKVVLADLGRVYFDSLREDANLLTAVKAGTDIVPAVVSIQARAFAWKTVVLPKEQQSIYVVVQDQTLTPVNNAMVLVTIHWSDGVDESTTVYTNNNGVAIVPLTVRDQTYGSLVTIDVKATFLDKTAGTVTSFRVWR